MKLSKENRTGALAKAGMIREGKCSVKESLLSVLERIEEEKELNAYITVDEEGALLQAERIQKEITEGRLTGPLAGTVLAVKDNICTEGILTTCGSKILTGFLPPYDATVIRALKEAGCIILGKTNMDEFGMGSTTESSFYGAVKNPFDKTRVAGGSSGGSAAAVAAGLADLALGSDTGGSVRLPAAWCGLVGLKPTYGSVSRYGLIAYASSMDQIGPVTHNTEDAAALFSVIAGRDPRDATSRGSGFSYEAYCKKEHSVKGLRIAVLRDDANKALTEDVKKRMEESAALLKERGALLTDVTLSSLSFALPAYYTIADAEASSNLARFDGVKYGYRAPEDGGTDMHRMYKESRSAGFGAQVKRRIMLGSYVLSGGFYEQYYKKAMQARELIRRELAALFETQDLLLLPVSPGSPPPLGEGIADPLKMYAGDLYTVLANLTGFPAVSMPAGTDREGLPVGVQLLGRAFEEERLLHAAAVLEEGRPG